MNLNWKTALLTVLLLAVSPAAISEKTGADLQSWCESSELEFEALCLGYFIGASDVGILLKSTFERDPDLGWCMENTDPSINRKVWESYVARHPEVLGKPALVGYVLSMREAFPCR